MHVASYLHNRKQHVKLINTFSDWSVIPKGVPQGSIIGSVAFNFFINDIFYNKLNSQFFKLC